jgi:hypothetical protein
LKTPRFLRIIVTTTAGGIFAEVIGWHVGYEITDVFVLAGLMGAIPAAICSSLSGIIPKEGRRLDGRAVRTASHCPFLTGADYSLNQSPRFIAQTPMTPIPTPAPKLRISTSDHTPV